MLKKNFNQELKKSNPDILNCLANLSNDEVFTPPSTVNKLLDLLPKKMKEIVKMKYLQNKKHRQIAESLSITENTVNTQLTRAKKKLRNLLY